MKIRCSHCGATYDMHEALLKESGHKVACSHCNQVFRASTLDGFLADAVGETSDGDPEMDELLAEMEETLAGLEQLELEKTPLRSSLPSALDTSIPPEMNQLKAEELPQELLFPTTGEQEKGNSGLNWFLAALLALLLLGQLAWLERDILLAKPELRALAERFCPYLGCTLPEAGTETHFILLDRRFEPAGPQIYRLGLLLQNASSKAESAPAVRITLRDSQQRLVARRTLEAPVYLQKKGIQMEPLAPGESLQVELTLAVPAGPISGYEIELL